ncbi:hypothetical protein HPB47_027931 [Ixodes persulcatus]|uniref:Uncharacterized protein n=1 Tax=Ixodes persulcatus TaxID=34615 RepID=A0AC60PV71_IXOPE|nr:hypothetical protein HPB47_027931 [Ixodes persulcatus]
MSLSTVVDSGRKMSGGGDCDVYGDNREKSKSEQLAFLLTFLHGRGRLYELFGQIEKEFESLYAENLAPRSNSESVVRKLSLQNPGILRTDEALSVRDR